MTHCPSCNTECSENANFCQNCGTLLKPQVNSKKNIQNNIDLSISNDNMTQALKRLMPTSYVEKLLSSKGKMEGERRIVTILFSDVKGSTTLQEKLDPEEVLEIMNGAFNILIEPITRYEGTLARLMGDAILAFFGAPIAHEDDPYRAVRAALDILKGAQEFSNKLEGEKGIKGFGVRVGINTGLVVVAEVGTDFRVEYTAMGDAVNIAARMESAAEPGTILITEATKKLIQNDFEVVSIGSIQVKGKSEPVNTYRILNIKKREHKTYSRVRFHSPLIGREVELSKLQEAFNRLHQGIGGIISITGDNGVGKSRLVSEVCKIKSSDLKWVEGRASTYTAKNSYSVIRSILKNFLGFQEESSDTNMLDSLYKKVETNFEDKVDEIYPFIEHFLKPSGKNKGAKSIEFNDVHAIRNQFHYAVKEFLKKESLQQPIVIVLEDLQWCDTSSLDLINELIPFVDEISILLILVYRIDENEKGIWKFHYNNLKKYDKKYQVISLLPFEENQSILFIKKLLGGQGLPSEIQNQVLEKTEGNPSFLEEVIHSIIEGEYLSQESYKSETISVKSELQIPGLLQSVIMTRVDSLEQPDKTMLQKAAVIGRVFQKTLLVKIMEDVLTDSEFEKSLYELQIREFVFRHLPANIISKKINFEKEYIFKQEITQNVVYNSLLLSQRQRLHRQIGEVIENQHKKDSEEFADSLAIHFEKGKVLNKAIHYNKVAADRAKNLFANEDAIFFYLKTLELSERNGIETLDLDQIHESLGDIYSLTAKYSKAIDHFKLSIKYSEDLKAKARINLKCGQIYEKWGKYKKALEHFNFGLNLLDGNDTEEVLTALFYAGIGMVYYRQGNLKEAEKLNTRAFLILKKYGGEMDIADIYNNLGIIYCKLKDLEKSLEYHQQCLNIREHAGIYSGIAASNNNIGYIYQLKNDFNKAIEYYNKSLEYCKKIGNLHGLARTYDNLSHLYIMQGKKEMAMDYNLKAVSILGSIAMDGSQISSDVWLQSGVW